MQNICSPREIINRKALLYRLDALAKQSKSLVPSHENLLEVLSNTILNGREQVKVRFQSGKLKGLDAAYTSSFLFDQIIRTIYEFATNNVYPLGNPTAGEQISILKTGGYGRCTLAPFSDIDLMFLLPYKLTAHSEQVIEFILYLLWDLGLKVGHATRSIDEAISLSRSDLTIRTSLLESRWLTGDKKLFAKFRAQFMNKLVSKTGPEFVEAKLAERDLRHTRMGDSRYVLEPNIKDGKGGLRDLQMLYWIVKYLYQVESPDDFYDRGILTKTDTNIFNKAERFFWTVRFHIHYISGRAEERMAFHLQADISERMGYSSCRSIKGVEQFMKDYFLTAKNVGNLTMILCSILEEHHKKKQRRFQFPSFNSSGKVSIGYKIDGGRVRFSCQNPLKKNPSQMLGLFKEAQRLNCELHPSALRLVTQHLNIIDANFQNSKKNNSIFLDILLGPVPDRALMRLNDAGVFGRFVTQFGDVIAQMQYDMYHVYTVDEHTIRAVGVLNQIENKNLIKDHPISCEVIREIHSRRVLYVAILLHDIAKGQLGDHSTLGAKIAFDLCPRFGLNNWETETVSWLVLNHLKMSRTAFKRDIHDPKTVADFAGFVQSPERLRLLLLLTVADIRAVGPNVWNSWKGSLLRDLYLRTQEVLSGDILMDNSLRRLSKVKSTLASRLGECVDPWPSEKIDAHLNLGFDTYWLNFDMDRLVRNANLIRRAEENGDKLVVSAALLSEKDAVEVIIFTPDHPGLFAKIAGAIASMGASIVDAKIVTLSTGMAFDTFWVRESNNNILLEKTYLDKLCAGIKNTLLGISSRKCDPRKDKGIAPKNNTSIFNVPNRVLIDNKASNTHTIIEINAGDRPGFLQDVTELITKSGLQISSAHISTYGERVVDVFYVKDVFGLKVENETKKNKVRKNLLSIATNDLSTS